MSLECPPWGSATVLDTDSAFVDKIAMRGSGEFTRTAVNLPRNIVLY